MSANLPAASVSVSDGPVLVVAGHADDEIIGAGNCLANLPDRRRERVVIAYLTDSAPLDPRFAADAGFATREQYAAARRAERHAALQIAGIAPEQCFDFGLPDQETWRHLSEITGSMSDLIGQLRPAMILTHPYEGGHPDHDSAAFAVHHAAAAFRPQVIEFTSYHATATGRETGRFLPFSSCPEQVTQLTDTERARKKAMFDCHHTQADVLTWFSLDEERFRPAPRYDFTQAPHEGTLHYEQFGWGITGAMWREAAREALQLLPPGSIWH